MLITDRHRNSEIIAARVEDRNGVTPYYLFETGGTGAIRSRCNSVTSLVGRD